MNLVFSLRNPTQRSRWTYPVPTSGTPKIVVGLISRSIKMGSYKRPCAMSLLCLMVLATTTNLYASDSDYYAETCPQANTIVRDKVHQLVTSNRNMAGGLLLTFSRLLRKGCDASVLLSQAFHSAEKDALPNRSLRGFEEIDTIKAAVEAECPGFVSCANILALAARDAVLKVGGEGWNVDLGRKGLRLS